jgi:hypothetical protein
MAKRLTRAQVSGSGTRNNQGSQGGQNGQRNTGNGGTGGGGTQSPSGINGATRRKINRAVTRARQAYQSNDAKLARRELNTIQAEGPGELRQIVSRAIGALAGGQSRTQVNQAIQAIQSYCTTGTSGNNTTGGGGGGQRATPAAAPAGSWQATLRRAMQQYVQQTPEAARAPGLTASRLTQMGFGFALQLLDGEDARTLTVQDLQTIATNSVALAAGILAQSSQLIGQSAGQGQARQTNAGQSQQQAAGQGRNRNRNRGRSAAVQEELVTA